MIYKRLYQAFIAFVLVTIVTACSKSDGTGGYTPPPSPPPTNNGKTVDINGMSFSPGSLTVKKGTKVTFKNNDGTSHTATADDGSFDTGTMASGASADITFSTVGSFPYHCNFHGGMTGTIVVNP